MTSRASAGVAVYMAWDTGANVYKTGDAANHRIFFIKDGVLVTPANTVTQSSGAPVPGAYQIAWTSAEGNCNTLWVGGTSSTVNIQIIPQTYTFENLPTLPTSLLVAGSGVNVTQINGVAAVTSSAQLGVNVVTWQGAVPAPLITGLVQTTQSGTISGGFNVAQWNGVNVGTIPPDIVFTHASQAQAGTATTITLDSSASRVDNFYINQIVYLTAGSGAGQSAFIAGYSGLTQVTSIVGTWAVSPSPNTKFALEGFGSVPATVQAGVNVTQWLGAVPAPLIGGLVQTVVSGPIAGSVATLASGVNVTQWLGVSPAPLVNALLQTQVSGAVSSVAGAVGSVTANVTVGAYVSGLSPSAMVWDTAAFIDGVSPRAALTYIAAAEAGLTSGALTTQFAIAGISSGGITRILATTDGSGNRAAVALS